MRPAVLVSLVLLFSAVVPVTAQADPNAAVIAELRNFYDTYAEDLRQQRREALADRYDRRGTYFLGNGSKSLETFEDGKRYYMTKWTGPKAFAWKDLEFEVLTPTAAAVVGRFDWGTEKDAKPKTCSYTGVLLKSGGRWRIRIEDESCPAK